MSFKDIKFPNDFDYSSDGDHPPIEFYVNAFPRSKEIHLKLGYFSSSAIRLLAYSFARFIYSGGILKIITNHYLYNEDVGLVGEKENRSVDNRLEDLEWLFGELSGTEKHFMNCLRYLVEQGRLEIIPVVMKPGKMVHYKQGVFVDNDGDRLAIEGSCNFTASGLIENGESIAVYRSWGSEYEVNKINSRSVDIDSIVKKENDKYDYLEKESIVNAILSAGTERSVEDLLRDELEVCSEMAGQDSNLIHEIIEQSKEELLDQINEIKLHPRFPFNSEPREYQKEAHMAWVDAGKKGLFAMATGTGKTITSLNCLLNEYKKKGTYQAIILVPTAALLAQWVREVKLFNFNDILTASSKNTSWRSEINELISTLKYTNSSFVIITTYATFITESFQRASKKLPEDTLMIADEAHNMGSSSLVRLIPEIKYAKRIGLSATPKRIYDEEGNKAIEDFFDSHEPYTYSFSMDRAIKEGYLCEYDYYPHIVDLSDEELDQYREISLKLIKFFNGDSLDKNDIVERLLLERKRVIHRAENKLFHFNDILKSIYDKKKDLKYTFVYVPEGNNKDGDNMMDVYLKSFYRVFP